MPNTVRRAGTMRSTRKMREESVERYRKRKAALAASKTRKAAAKRAATAPKRPRRTATAASTTPTPKARPIRAANTESGPPGTKGAPKPKSRPAKKGGRVVSKRRRYNIRALAATGKTRRRELRQRFNGMRGRM